MSTVEHAFANAFYHEFSQNGETGIPNVFMKTEATEPGAGPSISEREFDDAGRLIESHNVGIQQRGLEYSQEGARALFKTAVEIPKEVLELLRVKNHLGRVALTEAA